MNIDKSIEKWFNDQHYQPVMLQPDWKDIILKKEVYTKDVVLKLLQEFSERKTTTEVSENNNSKALHIADVMCWHGKLKYKFN